MKHDDIANAKEWASSVRCKDGDGWRPVIGRLAEEVVRLWKMVDSAKFYAGRIVSESSDARSIDYAESLLDDLGSQEPIMDCACGSKPKQDGRTIECSSAKCCAIVSAPTLYESVKKWNAMAEKHNVCRKASTP